MSSWKRPFEALRSRKVRVALATVVAAVLAEYGIGLSDTVLYGIVGVGTAIILGIAHEDHGAKSAAGACTLGVPTGPWRNGGKKATREKPDKATGQQGGE